MTTHTPNKQRSKPNPFSTRFIKPGAVDFIFHGGVTIEALADRFKANAWIGSIVGPHGCGKTTLACQLGRVLGRTCVVRWITVRPESQPKRHGFARMPRIHHDRTRSSGWDETSHESSQSLMVIDGLEQLSWLHRLAVVHHARARYRGLLVTSHRPVAGIPTLWHVDRDFEIFRAVAMRLQDQRFPLPGEALSRAFAQAKGNIREALFLLYDWHQQLSDATGIDQRT